MRGPVPAFLLYHIYRICDKSTKTLILCIKYNKIASPTFVVFHTGNFTTCRRGRGDFMACLKDACISFAIQMATQTFADIFQLTAYQSIVAEFCITLMVVFAVKQLKNVKKDTEQQAKTSTRQD